MGGRHRVRPVHFIFPVECNQSGVICIRDVISGEKVRLENYRMEESGRRRRRRKRSCKDP